MTNNNYNNKTIMNTFNKMMKMIGEDVEDIIKNYVKDLEQSEINDKNRKEICKTIKNVCFGNFSTPPYTYTDLNIYQVSIKNKDTCKFYNNEYSKKVIKYKIEEYNNNLNSKYLKMNNGNSFIYSSKNNNKTTLNIMNENGTVLIKKIRLSGNLLDKLDNGNNILITVSHLDMKEGDKFFIINNQYWKKKRYIITKR